MEGKGGGARFRAPAVQVAQPQDRAAGACSGASRTSPQRHSGPQSQPLAVAAQLQVGEQVQGSHLHSGFIEISVGLGTDVI